MRRTIAAASLVLASALLIASPSAAYAASYLDEAVQALQTGNVYVSVETQTIDAATKERLEQQTAGTNIGIVILPESARTEAGDLPQFVVDIARDSGKETVIVAVGSDLEAASRTLSYGSAGKLANDLERSSSSTGEALVEFVTEARSTQPVSPPQSGAEPDLSGGIGITAIVLIAAVIGAGVFAWVRSRRRPQVHPTQRQEAVNIPNPIKELLAEVRMQIPNIKDAEMREQLEQATTDTQELFTRLIRKKSNEIHQTTASYEGMMASVRNMLVKYADVQAHPRYYPDSKTLLTEGRVAAAQYAAGVLKNIQEVEQGSLTDFKVDIKMLASAHRPDDPIIH